MPPKAIRPRARGRQRGNDLITAGQLNRQALYRGACSETGDPCAEDADCPDPPAGQICLQPVNTVLQDYIRDYNDLQAGASADGREYSYGWTTPAGHVPKRNSLLEVRGSSYSDGSVTGSYYYWDGAQFVSIASGQDLARRNRVLADFDGNFVRDVGDGEELVAAWYAPRTWQRSDVAMGTASGGDLGHMDTDNAIPEVLGDFDGDGNLTKEDLRYWADGFAMVQRCSGSKDLCDDDGDCPGGETCHFELDRREGAIVIDTAIAALGEGMDYPWADDREQLLIPPAEPPADPTFETPADIGMFLITGKNYQPGDFRGDVAAGENGVRAGMPIPGAHPAGWDGVVDTADVDYVCRNLADWWSLDQAVLLDLSCDMNGDLALTYADVEELVEQILGTQIGDTDLDGDLDVDDLMLALDTVENDPTGCNLDGECGWADGDSDCNGIVDEADLAAFSAILGDFDGNGQVDLDDFAEFVPCRKGTDVKVPLECRVFDYDFDSDVDLRDFGAFQTSVTQ